MALLSYLTHPSLFSFLPPSTTLRRYIRTIHATTVAEIGQLYCDIVSDASAGGLGRAETGDVANNLVATRMKLQRSKALQKNVFYEVSCTIIQCCAHPEDGCQVLSRRAVAKSAI